MSVSRRDFLATSAAAAAAGIVGRPLFALGWQGVQAPPPQPVFTAIRRNVGYFTMRGGTIGYLVNPGAVVVVDSQFPAEATACLTGLNERSGNRGVDFLLKTQITDPTDVNGFWTAVNTESQRKSDFAPTMWAVITAVYNILGLLITSVIVSVWP